ncbi:MAG: hypothetical protein ACKVU4_05655 [Phycisphaerales bacterium]
MVRCAADKLGLFVRARCGVENMRRSVLEPFAGEPRTTVAVPAGPVGEAARRLRDRLRGLILLGGAVRASELSRGVGRSPLDLPVELGVSLLDLWRAEVSALAEAIGAEDMRVRVLIDADAVEPKTPAPTGRVRVSVERDRDELRGTGGLLRDACAVYADDDLVLVANANQVMLEPLAAQAAALAATGADAALVAHDDGAPVGVMLVRAGAMRVIRDRGFVDFKEQALPQIAARFDVRVSARPRGTAATVRTLDGYIDAVRAHHRLLAGRPVSEGPAAEDWIRTFAIVEPGATVDPTARIHDAVILTGATVRPGAVVVRSLVGPGAIVGADETVSDEVVSAEGSARTRGDEGGVG